MAKDPAFLFYSQDFFLGTSTMSFEDRGKFITILCLMHQQGRMSEESICFIVGSISVNLKKKFIVDENGMWYNERLEIETQKRNKFTESRRENGLQGGRGNKKNNKIKANAKLMQKHKDNLMEDENEDTVVSKELINSEKKVFKKVAALPESLDICKSYFKELGFENEAFRFFDFYESKGWLVGKAKMKSWQAAARNWVRGKVSSEPISKANQTILAAADSFKNEIKY